MSDLSEITINEIEEKIMAILYASIDIEFNQFTLYDRLIHDKFDSKFTNTISPNFKAKFLLVLRNLMSHYDDIQVNKVNNIFHLICFSNDTKKNEFNDKIINNKESFNKEVKENKENKFSNKNDINNIFNEDKFNLAEYIISNNLINEYNLTDPWDGNSIYHELVLENSYVEIKKLIENNEFNYFILNKHNETPIQLSKNIKISNLITSGLMNKFSKENKKLIEDITNLININTKLENKIKLLESDDNKNAIINETSIFKFFKLKIFKFYQDYKFIINSIIFISILSYLIEKL